MEVAATGTSADAAPGAATGNSSAEFTAEDVRAALAINSPKLVKELYEITQRRVAYETGRQQRLDAKATSLLTAAGVSVTLAFTFTGAISSNEGHELFHRVFNYVLAAFGLALASGFTAAGFALKALFISKGYAGPENRVVFARDILKKANDLAPDPNDKNETEAQVDEWRLMEYQKWIIRHFWAIAEKQERTHELKAGSIYRGQLAFTGFLFFVVVVCSLVGSAVYWRHHHVAEAAARPAAAAAATAEGTSRNSERRERSSGP